MTIKIYINKQKTSQMKAKRAKRTEMTCNLTVR